MTERDQYDEQAERLLPIGYDDVPATMRRYHTFVAAALREAGKREAELRRTLDKVTADYNELAIEYDEASEQVELISKELGDAEVLITQGPIDGVTKLINERDDLRREVERLNGELQKRDKCSYIGPMRDCPTHGESAEIKTKVDQLTAWLREERASSDVLNGKLGEFERSAQAQRKS